ncbi:MAG TPA: carbohydrate porin, partial [Luteitalea sp.]|nr:carbohydrate porin [Luteitalea sp.]
MFRCALLALRRPVLIVIGLALIAAPTRAQDALLAPALSLDRAAMTSASAPTLADARDWFGQRPWREWAAATGDWSAIRSWLDRRGFDVAVGETADATTIAGASTGRRLHMRGLLDGTITADATALRIPGSSALAQVQWLPGHDASGALGLVQSLSNIDAIDVPLLGEAWYQQEFGSRARLKVGRVDANSDFAAVDAAADFLSASMGFSPSIVALPSYPLPASSISLFVEPVSGVELGGGLFNGTPGDGRWVGWQSRFTITQARVGWTTGAPVLTGHASGGWWRHDDHDTVASGTFVAAEQTFWADEDRSVAAFAQFGSSDRESAIHQHVGGGVATRGLFARRRQDVTGLGVTLIRLAPDEATAPNELAVEWFHRLVLTPSISVIPDVQWIQHPGGD